MPAAAVVCEAVVAWELAAALLHRPAVLFLDEPTIGLDVAMQVTIREFIREYNARHDATVMLTSHYMDDVVALCPRIIVIDQGVLKAGHGVYTGSAELKDGPLHIWPIMRFFREYFGYANAIEVFKGEDAVEHYPRDLVAESIMPGYPFLAKTPLKAEQIQQTGAKVVVAACENCRLQIGALNEHYKLNVHITAITDLVVRAMRLPKPLPGQEAEHLFEGEKVEVA